MRIMVYPSTIVFICALINLVWAFKGPHPSDITPSSYASSDLKKVQIPFIKPKCGRTKPPTLTHYSLSTPWYNDLVQEIRVTPNLCRGSSDKLRIRLLEYRTRLLPNGKKIPFTKVLDAETWTTTYSFHRYMKLRCQTFDVYLEVCVRSHNKSRPLCSMTEVKKVRRAVVPSPHLKFRPPYILRLAPGDRARIVNEIVTESSGLSRFPNGEYEFKNRKFLLRSFIRGKKGWTVHKGKQSKKPRTSVFIHRWETRDWKQRILNGSTSFLKFALASCPSNEGSYQDLYSTKIVIDKSVASLVRQDNKPPTFEEPKFPRARLNDTVYITVNAKNPGRGFRKGGVPTELHYQWYLRTKKANYKFTFPEPIEGETRKTLRIQNATCKVTYGGEISSYNYQEYFVDVCNTFGCQRSKMIEPEFISDKPGKKIGSDCFLKDDK